jgi:hypothetical protein
MSHDRAASNCLDDFDRDILGVPLKLGESRRESERAGYGEQIVATLSHELSWSHFRELQALDKPLQREFYAEMCRMEGWSVRTLRGRIDSMLYERTALSRRPEEQARQELATLKESGEVGPALVLKDPTSLTSWA